MSQANFQMSCLLYLYCIKLAIWFMLHVFWAICLHSETLDYVIICKTFVWRYNDQTATARIVEHFYHVKLSRKLEMSQSQTEPWSRLWQQVGKLQIFITVQTLSWRKVRVWAGIRERLQEKLGWVDGCELAGGFVTGRHSWRQGRQVWEYSREASEHIDRQAGKLTGVGENVAH